VKPEGRDRRACGESDSAIVALGPAGEHNPSGAKGRDFCLCLLCRRDGVSAPQGEAAMNAHPARPETGRVRNRVRVLQRKLYRVAKADSRRRFGALYDKVWRRDVLGEAVRRVIANQGSAGVDGQTIAELKAYGVSKFIAELQAELREKRYRPNRVRRCYIPKPDGRKRPLGIPTLKDRVVQMAANLVVGPIFEADFQDGSYGFRPRRNAHDAHQVIRYRIRGGAKYVVDVDIQSYFDTIPHDKLMVLVQERISDKWVLRLVRGWLKAGVLEGGKVEEPSAGTPQGGVISPLLANIYLNLVDRIWERRGYQSERGRWTGALVRYADDMVVLCRTPEAARFYLRALRQLFGRMGLTLNEEKSRIATVEEGFDFLGLHFREGWSRGGTPRRFALSFPCRKAMKSARRRIKDVIRRHPLSATVGEVVGHTNEVLRGWGNYFRHSNASLHFKRVDLYALDQLRLFLRRKHQAKAMRFRRRYPMWYFYRVLGLHRLVGTVRRA